METFKLLGKESEAHLSSRKVPSDLPPKTDPSTFPGADAPESMGPGWGLVRSQTARIDACIGELFRRETLEGHDGMALVALGGYGRREMCPFSDVDLLFLVDRSPASEGIREVISRIVYPLWDQQLDVSHSVRTCSETIQDAAKDLTFFTSLLDARLLCGSKATYERLVSRFERKLLPKSKDRWFVELLKSNEARYAQFGDDTYALEPDVKEGQGGLRDYHTAVWAAKMLHGKVDMGDLLLEGLIPEPDRIELMQALDFLFRVRAALHLVSNWKNNRLLFEYQKPLAWELEYRGSTENEAVEAFMKAFHREVFSVKTISGAFLEHVQDHLRTFKDRARFDIDRFFEVVSGRIHFRDPDAMNRNPALMISLFAHMARLGRNMHPSARLAVRDHLDLVPLARGIEQARNDFRGLLTADCGGDALSAMLETGVLERFLPDFERIRGQTQYDSYHVHTVDHHSIQAVYELKGLEKTEAGEFEQVENRDLLYMTVFLHDIGKGVGVPHTATGVPLVYDIARWLGFSQKEAEKAGFLVKKHLTMADTATRRDLSEERTSFRFALDIGDADTLRMLYLITIADSKATGPAAWGAWKAALVRELYSKALKILEKGSLKGREAVEELERRWETLREEAKRHLGEERTKHLDFLPQAYVLSYDASTIIEHVGLSETVTGPNDVRVEVKPKARHFQVTIVAQDRPGLFARMAGAFSLHHFDVRAGKIFTWFNGLAVDVFEVSPPWPEYDRWPRIVSDLQKAVTGRLALTARITALKPPIDKGPKVKSTAKPKVVIDNESSDFHTIIEVHAPDRVGLLFQIAKAISEFDLDISRAYISNKGDLAADAFYVSTLVGEKVEDPVLQKEIVTAIEHSLA